jgi:hypothetical protein
MLWYLSNRFDKRVLPLADRHYNRQKIGSPQFVPPGRCLVLLTEEANALWVTSWPFSQFVKHAWPNAWICSCFRNESLFRASELIIQALAATRFHFGEPPENGVITFINTEKVKRTRKYGYTYLKAGFIEVGKTKGGLLALQMESRKFPPAQEPCRMLTRQMSLFL